MSARYTPLIMDNVLQPLHYIMYYFIIKKLYRFVIVG